MVELEKILANCPQGKAPGLDGVSYEFYCDMDYGNRLLLFDYFNYILAKKEVPKDWCKLIMFLLHKKGDPANFDNYRGISLLNSIAKLFTPLVVGRLTWWADRQCNLPEWQAGFKPGCSCTDNIFVLLTVVHSQIQIPSNWHCSIRLL